ncbi:TraC family protein, partial [Escherichia coli]
MVFPLFKKKVKTEAPAQAVASAACAHETGAGDAGIYCNLTRPGRMTRREEAKIYHAGPSIIDFLPWVEYLDEEQCLLLDDGVSVGAVYEVTPAATEGRTAERL